MTINFPRVQDLRTGIRGVSKAPGVCSIYQRVKGRMCLVGAVLPGSKFGPGAKIGRTK